jgi:hypothetical protein
MAPQTVLLAASCAIVFALWGDDAQGHQGTSPRQQAPDGRNRNAPPIRLPQKYSRAAVQEVFKSADRDGNDWLSLREMGAFFQTDRREFRVFDVNGDGKVDIDEFDTQAQRLIENGAILHVERTRLGAVTSKPASSPSDSGPTASGPTASGPFRFGTKKKN